MKMLMSCLILIYSFVADASRALCPTIILDGEDKLEFNEQETRLMCGDEKLHAYQFIPPYEAQVFMTSFLQTRGYLNPSFEIKGNTLHVLPGNRFYMSQLEVLADDKDIQEILMRKLRAGFKNELITPSLLNKMESLANQTLRNMGRPCAQQKAEVSIEENVIRVTVSNLTQFKFGPVKKEKIDGLRDNALDRFYAFSDEDTFDADVLNLTEKRMLRADVVQGTYFIERCPKKEGENFSLTQNFIAGPPRTLRFGVGASTEVGPMTRIKWSNNRYKSMASQLFASLQASFRSQSLLLSADSFIWKDHPLRSLLTQFEITRESQFDYEQFYQKLGTDVKWIQDSADFQHVYTTGPTFERGTFSTIETGKTKSFNSLTLNAGFRRMSHNYEFFDFHPQEGENLGAKWELRHPTLGFNTPALKTDIEFVKLKRISPSGKGQLVGGMSYNLGTTWVKKDISLNELPPSVKFFGGGSDDNRGFLLKTLPKNDGQGAFTRASAKFELRKTHFIKESLELFGFVDNSYFGDKSWELDSRLWYSPGVGIRWISPIGMVQAYAARALTLSPREDLGNFFYLGLGGSF